MGGTDYNIVECRCVECRDNARLELCGRNTHTWVNESAQTQALVVCAEKQTFPAKRKCIDSLDWMLKSWRLCNIVTRNTNIGDYSIAKTGDDRSLATVISDGIDKTVTKPNWYLAYKIHTWEKSEKWWELTKQWIWVSRKVVPSLNIQNPNVVL